MAASVAALQLVCTSNLAYFHHSSSDTKQSKYPHTLHDSCFTRRSATASLSTIFVTGEAFSNRNVVSALDLRLTVPDQTVEEAESMVKNHARQLLQIKALVEEESWREAQFALRESSSYLKQDLYTIIQAKPPGQRPTLRKLYSDLFNNVSKLDYAARSRDADSVKECYNNIAATIDEIFAKI